MGCSELFWCHCKGKVCTYVVFTGFVDADLSFGLLWATWMLLLWGSAWSTSTVSPSAWSTTRSRSSKLGSAPEITLYLKIYLFRLHYCFVFLMLIVVALSLFNIQLRRMRGSINFFVSVLLSVTDDEFMVMSGNWKVLRCSITTFKTFLAPRQWWAAAPRRPGPVRWCA